MEFTCYGTSDGGLDFGQHGKAYLRQYIAEHPGVRFKMMPIVPESSSQRRYFEGAVVPLVTFYQPGMSHANSEDLRKVREWLKLEFNGEVVSVAGSAHKVGRSTKGRAALGSTIERITDWLIDTYSPPAEAMDPESYKRWRDSVAPFGGPDSYIDYLIELEILRMA